MCTDCLCVDASSQKKKKVHRYDSIGRNVDFTMNPSNHRKIVIMILRVQPFFMGMFIRIPSTRNEKNDGSVHYSIVFME